MRGGLSFGAKNAGRDVALCRACTDRCTRRVIGMLKKSMGATIKPSKLPNKSGVPTTVLEEVFPPTPGAPCNANYRTICCSRRCSKNPTPGPYRIGNVVFLSKRRVLWDSSSTLSALLSRYYGHVHDFAGIFVMAPFLLLLLGWTQRKVTAHPRKIGGKNGKTW